MILYHGSPIGNLKELNFVYDDMKKTISQYNLKNCVDSPMSQFIVTHFPKVWLE